MIEKFLLSITSIPTSDVFADNGELWCRYRDVQPAIDEAVEAATKELREKNNELIRTGNAAIERLKAELAAATQAVPPGTCECETCRPTEPDVGEGYERVPVGQRTDPTCQTLIDGVWQHEKFGRYMMDTYTVMEGDPPIRRPIKEAGRLETPSPKADRPADHRTAYEMPRMTDTERDSRIRQLELLASGEKGEREAYLAIKANVEAGR